MMPSYMGLSSRSARIGRGAVAIPPATVGGVQAPHRELGGTVRHQSLDELLALGDATAPRSTSTGRESPRRRRPSRSRRAF
jgi:hypothetical protein